MKFRTLLAIMLLSFSAFLLAQCSTKQAKDDNGSKTYKMAALFPGEIADSDYNTLGYLGLESIRKDMKIKTAYSEDVAVADSEEVMQKYIESGYNIIFAHGGQFMNKTEKMARQFPDIYFIGEGDGAVENPPPNLWVIDRNFQVGFYGLGALAALQSKTGKIAYLGGLTLPFSYAEVHAMQQAIDDLGLDIELTPVWVGDFNDTAKAQEVAAALIADDNDVLVGSLNQGMQGIFEAVKTTPQEVWVTAKYTDKSPFAPDNYLASLLYDFTDPMKAIVTQIIDGNTGGYYPLGFDTGASVKPTEHVPDDIRTKVDTLINAIAQGKIKVIENTDPVP